MKGVALAALAAMVLSACGLAETGSSTTDPPPTSAGGVTETTVATPPSVVTTELSSFPVIIEDDVGAVEIPERPGAIISLSSVATDMLFEIGAGEQVVAVDDQSNYPPEAPMTDLSGFTPNLEAILSYEPDLVVISFDPGELASGIQAAGVPVLMLGAAVTIEDVYRQIRALGEATGNSDSALGEIQRIEQSLADVVAAAGRSGEGVSYYHEIDSNYYSATSSTFFGEIYGLFGMVSIADPADEDGSALGYPQLSAEYIVSQDPDIVFLANTAYGVTAADVAKRPGWDALTAVRNGYIVELDSDVASRWGPRIVDLAQAVANALGDYGEG